MYLAFSNQIFRSIHLKAIDEDSCLTIRVTSDVHMDDTEGLAVTIVLNAPCSYVRKEGSGGARTDRSLLLLQVLMLGEVQLFIYMSSGLIKCLQLISQGCQLEFLDSGHLYLGTQPA